jgi:chromosome partitioning protein
MTRIIAVANEKGGVGKTVTVLNLGAGLSKRGKTVLFVDMDPQANTTKGIGVAGPDVVRSTYDLIRGEVPGDGHRAILKTRWEGIDLVPAHTDLAGAEVELVEVDGRENRLKSAMRGIDGTYDFILLDTPPSLSLLTVNVFAYAQEVIVPCQTHPYAFDALEELFDTLAAIQAEINPSLKVAGILATMFDQRTRVSRRVLDKLGQDPRYRGLLFKTVIRANTTIADSADVGKPVVFYRSGSFGAADYLDFADEILADASAGH